MCGKGKFFVIVISVKYLDSTIQIQGVIMHENKT